MVFNAFQLLCRGGLDVFLWLGVPCSKRDKAFEDCITVITRFPSWHIDAPSWHIDVNHAKYRTFCSTLNALKTHNNTSGNQATFYIILNSCSDIFFRQRHSPHKHSRLHH